MDALKVTLVVGDENASRLTAGQRDEDVIGECFRDPRDFQSVRAGHFGKDVAGSVPGIRRRRNRSIDSLKDFEDMTFQCFAVLIASHASAQFLGNYHTQMLKRRKKSMKLLECFVRGGIAKGVDEQLRIENVFVRTLSHRSASGGVISIPSIARVPSTSSR